MIDGLMMAMGAVSSHANQRLFFLFSLVQHDGAQQFVCQYFCPPPLNLSTSNRPQQKATTPFTIWSHHDVLFHMAAIGLIGGPSIARAQNQPSNEEEEEEEEEEGHQIYSLLSGMQFCIVSIGSGPLVTKESLTS
jgi:hypothetical protein